MEGLLRGNFNRTTYEKKYRAKTNDVLRQMKWPIREEFKNDLLVQHELSVAAAVNSIVSSHENQPPSDTADTDTANNNTTTIIF